MFPQQPSVIPIERLQLVMRLLTRIFSRKTIWQCPSIPKSLSSPIHDTLLKNGENIIPSSDVGYAIVSMSLGTSSAAPSKLTTSPDMYHDSPEEGLSQSATIKDELNELFLARSPGFHKETQLQKAIIRVHQLSECLQRELDKIKKDEKSQGQDLESTDHWENEGCWVESLFEQAAAIPP